TYHDVDIQKSSFNRVNAAAFQQPGIRKSTQDTLNKSLSATTLFSEYELKDSVSTGVMVKQEASLLLRSGIPVVLTYLLQYSFTFVNLLVLGHIGADALAAAALANMTIIVIVNAPAVGLASALDTYCSTAFTASQDTTLVGFHLQRGIIAVTGHFLFIVPLLWNIDTLFIWLKQDPTVSHMCCHFMRVQLLGSLAWMYFECIKRYLQAQGHMRASTVVLLIIAPIHVANNCMFVWSPVPSPNVVTYWLMFVLITVYAARSDARNAWGGWNVHALWTMPQYFKLAIPSMIMICSECVAVCNHVGNLLGQGRSRRAKVCAMVGLSLVLHLGLAVGSWWGGIYSDDTQIIAIVALIMPANALFQLADAINSVGSGVLRSMGRQDAGAWINFSSYYILGFPLGLFLTYGPPKIGVLGLWYGIFSGVALAVVMQCWIILRADWDDEVQRCIDQVSKDSDAIASGAASTASASDDESA
ncbi:mate-domain-containing protein, partial [Linderina pennispora]